MHLYRRQGTSKPQCLSDVHTGIIQYEDLTNHVHARLLQNKKSLDDENLRGVFVLFDNQEIPVMSLDQLEIVLKMIAVSLSNNFLQSHSVSFVSILEELCDFFVHIRL